MKTLQLLQGSPEWHAHRATARNASEAPAVLGCSPYMSRAQLLQQRHTGLRPEVDAGTQRRFDDGHAVEAAQRPEAEQIIGEPLYPVVGVEIVDGLELSASFDGLTMAEDVGYECKSLNDELRACLSAVGGIDANNGHDLPKHYRVQMEQQLMVSGAERILFVAADRNGDDVRRCWYYPDPELGAEILAGWRQFEQDLAAYVPTDAPPKLVAEPVEALPAVLVQVTGQLAVADNFAEFERRLRDFLEHRLIREPKTDQDFADLDAQIKAMKDAEQALDRAESQMLAQVQTIDQAKRTKDMLAKLVRDNRLMAEKLLAAEKERRRGEIVAGGVTALREHIAKLNGRFPRPLMPATATAVDFGGAIKGKKSLTSMEDAVAVTLANAKIAANEIADGIDANLKHFAPLAEEWGGHFADLDRLVLKGAEDFAAAVAARIAEQRAAAERRAAALAERERERIRAEEAAKLQAEQRGREAQERREREEAEAAARRQREAEEAQARQQAQAAAPAPTPAPAPIASPATVSQAAAPSPNVVPIQRAPAGPPTLKLGEISARLGFTVTADFLARLGFPAAGKDRAAILFHEADFHRMCDSLVRHIQAVREQRRAA